MQHDDDNVISAVDDKNIDHQNDLSPLKNNEEDLIQTGSEDESETNLPLVYHDEDYYFPINDDDDVYYDDDDVNNPSSETAGIVRGATKTILTGSRRGVRIVRKPLKIANAKPSFPQKVPTRQVVKVSDRLSTGFDVLSSAEESSNDNLFGKEKTPSPIKTYSARALAFTGALLKNSILGIAVFETYEKWIEKMDSVSLIQSNGYNKQVDAFSRVPVYHHFLAGSFAGVTFSLCSHLIELVISRGRIIPTAAVAVSSTVHHALSNSIIFGAYEGSKRLFFKTYHSSIDDIEGQGKEDNKKDDNDPNNRPKTNQNERNFFKKMNETKLNDLYSVRLSDIIMIGAAGSFAAVTQHIVSHYSESLLKVNDGGISLAEISAKMKGKTLIEENTKSKSNRFSLRVTQLCQQFRRQMPQLPTIRGILGAVPATAIGFIAFEYGKDIFNHTE